MASVVVYDRQFNHISSTCAPHQSLMDQVKSIEKRVFPKNEAMDLDMEMRKRNSGLTIVAQEVDADPKPGNSIHWVVCAYLLHARTSGVALLHKVCVVESVRRQGLAARLLSDLMLRLQKQSCEKVQLWVDASRLPARLLYESMGFKQTSEVKDYYGPNRDGMKMEIIMAG